MNDRPPPIGLIPCAGHAKRLAPLPCSKEVLPVEFERGPDGAVQVKVVSQFLLENMRRGGVRSAFFILREGKWDIPAYYGAGVALGMELAYLLEPLPYGPPYTLDRAYPFVRGHPIAIGFPDILLGPPDAYARAFTRLAETGADLVVGLYRAHDATCSDMVDVDGNGSVRDLIIKPPETTLTWSWMLAVWTPDFTEYLHEYLVVPRTSRQGQSPVLPDELTVGHVLQAAIRAGVDVQSVAFPADEYLDIGTPDTLKQAIKHAHTRDLDSIDGRSARLKSRGRSQTS